MLRKLIAVTMLAFISLCLVLPLVIAQASVVKGTNSGFVTVAPSADPLGSNITIDDVAKSIKDTAPAGATAITEIGWWCRNATEAANFEVGLYSHNAVDDKPNALLFSNTTNAKGTAAGWKVVAVDWAITAGTIYWIAIQLDNTSTTTVTAGGKPGGENRISRIAASVTTLPASWPTSTEIAGDIYAFYAVYTTTVAESGQVIIISGDE